MTTLDILISTYSNRIENIKNILLPENEAVRYLIGHQGYFDISCDVLHKRKDVFYYSLESSGVTKSRNALLDRSDADIVYFCDDDVVLESNLYNLLISYHRQYSEQILTFKVKNEYGENRKSYSKNSKKLNRLNILSVGTIEISMKNNTVKGKFQEDMGAGSFYPVGDEAVFLSCFLSKDQGVRYVPEFICMHPDESSGLIVNDSSIIARGVTLKRVYGWLSYFVGIAFLLKNAQLFNGSNISITLKNIKKLYQGMYKG